MKMVNNKIKKIVIGIGLLYLLSKTVIAKPILKFEDVGITDTITFDLGEIKYLTIFHISFSQTTPTTSGNVGPSWGVKFSASEDGVVWQPIINILKPMDNALNYTKFIPFIGQVINPNIRYIKREPWGYTLNGRGNFTLTYR